MIVVVTFELPMQEEIVSRMIEKAREVGHPLLAVGIQVEADLADAPADGMTADMVAGIRIGEAIAELEHEFAAMGGPSRARASRVKYDEEEL